MPDPTVAQVLPHVERAIEARELERAFELLAPFHPSLTQDHELASVWLTLLRIAPSQPSLVEDAKAILERWPTDFGLVTSACDALIRAAELAGPDAPQIALGPATLAAAAAERCLASLSPEAATQAAQGGYLQMNRANALRLARRFEEAADAYAAALATDAANGDWWFNRGLFHKAAHDFAAALEDNQRAHALLGDQRGVLWNIAICATALGKGSVAVEALKKIGFDAKLQDTGMPLVDAMPPVQVRVATRGSGHGMTGPELDRGVAFELVWVSPASPVHGVVQTATFRDGSADYGDLVLWDGTPVGITEHEGRRVPRFPLLSILRPGDEKRFRFVALEQAEGDLLAFGDALPHEARIFVHRATIEMLCARCATGDHMRKHEHLKAEPHRLVYGKMVIPGAVDLREFRVALEPVLHTHSNIQLVMPALLEAVGDAPAAGKAHQLWRGLERTALKRERAD